MRVSADLCAFVCIYVCVCVYVLCVVCVVFCIFLYFYLRLMFVSVRTSFSSGGGVSVRLPHQSWFRFCNAECERFVFVFLCISFLSVCFIFIFSFKTHECFSNFYFAFSF